MRDLIGHLLGDAIVRTLSRREPCSQYSNDKHRTEIFATAGTDAITGRSNKVGLRVAMLFGHTRLYHLWASLTLLQFFCCLGGFNLIGRL